MDVVVQLCVSRTPCLALSIPASPIHHWYGNNSNGSRASREKGWNVLYKHSRIIYIVVLTLLHYLIQNAPILIRVFVKCRNYMHLPVKYISNFNSTSTFCSFCHFKTHSNKNTGALRFTWTKFSAFFPHFGLILIFFCLCCLQIFWSLFYSGSLNCTLISKNFWMETMKWTNNIGDGLFFFLVDFTVCCLSVIHTRSTFSLSQPDWIALYRDSHTCIIFNKLARMLPQWAPILFW